LSGLKVKVAFTRVTGAYVWQNFPELTRFPLPDTRLQSRLTLSNW